MTQSKYEELYHHGIKGQRWGIRRYQNPDGSLTAAGQKRYNTIQKAKELAEKDYQRFSKDYDKYAKKVNEQKSKIPKMSNDFVNKTIEEDFSYETDKKSIISELRDMGYTGKNPIRDYAEEKWIQLVNRPEDQTRLITAASAKGGAEWVKDRLEKISNKPVYEITNREYKRAKSFIENYKEKSIEEMSLDEASRYSGRYLL